MTNGRILMAGDFAKAPSRKSLAKLARYGLCVASLCHAAQSAHAAGTPSDCHGLVDPTSRLVCYDETTERPNFVPKDASDPGPHPAPTVDLSAPVTPPSMRGLPTPLPAPAEIAPSRIVELEQTSIGRFRFHLENGEVWEQLEPGRITVRKGDVVHVREGRFGNWTLRAVDHKSRSVRVRRYI